MNSNNFNNGTQSRNGFLDFFIQKLKIKTSSIGENC